MIGMRIGAHMFVLDNLRCRPQWTLVSGYLASNFPYLLEPQAPISRKFLIMNYLGKGNSQNLPLIMEAESQIFFSIHSRAQTWQTTEGQPIRQIPPGWTLSEWSVEGKPPCGSSSKWLRLFLHSNLDSRVSAALLPESPWFLPICHTRLSSSCGQCCKLLYPCNKLFFT